MGNGPYADGTWQSYLHPSQNVYELRHYREMGEVPYVEMRKKEAEDWIRQHPARFLKVSLFKFVYYWAGVPRLSNIPGLAQTKNSIFLATSVLAWWGLGRAIRQRKRAVFLFACLMIVYPFTYYIVFAHARYRHPIEPAMMILGMYLISETRELKRKAWEAATRGQLSPNDGRPAVLTLSIIIPCYNEQNTIRNVVDCVRRAHLSHDGNDAAAGLRKEIVIVDDFSRDGTREVLAQLEEEGRYSSGGVPVRIYYHDHNQGKGAAVRTGIKSATGDLVIIQDADLEYDPSDFPALLSPILAGRADFEPEVTIKSAKLGCRIYEVPIAYHGRTYAEGKKIGWRDGVAAMWHMIKYRFFD
jgi:hypothetical protein